MAKRGIVGGFTFDTTAGRAMDEGKKRGRLQPSSIP